jgi:hypothetical protein
MTNLTLLKPSTARSAAPMATGWRILWQWPALCATCRACDKDQGIGKKCQCLPNAGRSGVPADFARRFEIVHAGTRGRSARKAVA